MQPRVSGTLVAFFTRSGNTQVIAGTVHRLHRTTLFQIRPESPYPEDYEQTVEQARQESERGFRPPLEALVPDFGRYTTVYLGFPIWGETAPPVIRSFLKSHDWRNKTLRPFITHGGYNLGNSMDIVRNEAIGATIVEPFVMEADQERRTLNQVKQWLGASTPDPLSKSHRQQKERTIILHRPGSLPSQPGPADFFTGTVRIDPLNAPPAPARHSCAAVTFEPGARSA